MPQQTGIKIVVEGRTFVQELPSYEQRFYVMEQADDAGLTELDHLQLDPATQSLEKIVRRTLIKAYKSGCLFKLLAALLTEEGHEWTKESALLNAKFFSKVRDPASVEQMNPAMAGAILAFFETAASSDLTSLISLDEAEHERPTPGTSRLTETQLAAVYASGSLPTSSARSPITTGSTRGSSSDGKSVKGLSRTKRSSKSR